MPARTYAILMRVRPSLVLLTSVLAAILAGCGGTPRGGGGPADVESPHGDRGGRVVATLGDSIVAGSPLWDPDPAVRATFDSPDRASQWQRWVDTDARLRNCGVWGERTDEIADRYERCTDGADAVVIQGGINDIVQGRPVADAARDLACIAERARIDGLDIALAEVLPWNRGYPDAVDEIEELNRRIGALGQRGGVPVLPFHSVLEDPRAPGRMRRSETDDGNHPNVDGYRRLGEQAWQEPRAATAPFARDC